MKSLSNFKTTWQRGRPAMNVLRIAANVADTETVTIGRDVYEFNSTGGYTAGRIPVVIAGLTPTLASAALVAAINASGTHGLHAVAISANEVLVVSRDAGVKGALACSETMGGTNNAWAAATMYAGSEDGLYQSMLQSRAANATEVALGGAHFWFPFTVAGAIAQITRAGVVLAWDGAVTITGQRVTLDNAGSTDWQAADVLNVLAAS